MQRVRVPNGPERGPEYTGRPGRIGRRGVTGPVPVVAVDPPHLGGSRTRPHGLVSRSARGPADPRRDRRSRSLLTVLYERIRFGIGRQTHDAIGLFLTLAGLLVVLAFFGGAGWLGQWSLDTLRFLVGVWVYAVPVLLLALGGALLLGRYRDDFRQFLVGAFLWFVGSLTLFHLMAGSLPLAGEHRGGQAFGWGDRCSDSLSPPSSPGIMGRLPGHLGYHRSGRDDRRSGFVARRDSRRR